MEKPPYLHIYSQTMGHDHSFIVGNREALLLLRDAINAAIDRGEGETLVFVNDGEGYNVAVYEEDDDAFWDKAQRPYTDEPSQDTRDDAIDPWQLFRKYKERKHDV